MFQKLVSHNEDLNRLVEKGFAVGFDSNLLIIRDIPYLNEKRDLLWGAIVSKLVPVDGNKVIQEDHQILFAGAHPHGLDGKPIPNLGGGEHKLALSEYNKDVVVQRSFSNKPCVNGKPVGKFADHFEKITSYLGIISGPAIELHNANPYTSRTSKGAEDKSVFKFTDSLTSRAEISDLSKKFENDVVAVIGLGGTGSYGLDFLVKTPVREIRAFDADWFYIHNSFRSPGMLRQEELGKQKAEIYAARYDNFRHGLSIKPKFIDASCGEELDGVTFAFVFVDKGTSRAEIFDLLISKKIPFIDAGMGLNRKLGPINGMMRATYYSAENGAKIRDQKLAELFDAPENMYRTNIQIGELNALNAALAVIKFKQLRGFYLDENSPYHLLLEISDLKIVGKFENEEN